MRYASIGSPPSSGNGTTVAGCLTEMAEDEDRREKESITFVVTNGRFDSLVGNKAHWLVRKTWFRYTRFTGQSLARVLEVPLHAGRCHCHVPSLRSAVPSRLAMGFHPSALDYLDDTDGSCVQSQAR